MTLAYTELTAPDATPERDLYFLHGILGSRANWRSIARRLVASRPDLRAVLVDLREHGDSGTQAGAWTLEACADDLEALATAFGRPVAGVLGHSFGGKVALTWSRRRHLEELWMVDSTPSARPDRHGSEQLLEVLSTLRVQPRQWPSRAALVERLVELGIGRPLAQWLAMNLRPRPEGGLALPIDFDAIEALLEDYFTQDLWPLVEAPTASALHLVIGGRSGVYDETDRERALAVAREQPSVFAHVLPQAGHFVHVDAPGELLALMGA